MSELVRTKQANPFSFKGEKGEMILNMTFQRDEDEKAIHFLLTHKSKSDRYTLVIREDYIQQQDPHFRMVVETMQDLFEHIIESFQEFTVTENGLIRFCIKLTSSKKQHLKQYELQAIKTNDKNIDILQIAEQMKQLRKQILEDLARKDQRIAALQKQIKTNKQIDKMRKEQDDNLENQFNIFKAEIQSKLNKKNMHEDTVTIQLMNRFSEKNQRQMIEIKQSIDQIANKVKNVNYEVEAVMLTVTIQKAKLVDLTQSLTDIQKKQKQKIESAQLYAPFKENIENPHRGYFKVSERQNYVQITQIQQSNWFLNYISARPLLRNCKQTFIIKQVQTKICSIYIGIGTKNAFTTLNSMNSKQTITYWCQNGQIYKNGSGRQGGRRIQDGETMLMTVDMEGWMIDWTIQGQLKQITSIPQHLRNQQLYIFIMMDKKGDTVQIMI